MSLTKKRKRKKVLLLRNWAWEYAADSKRRISRNEIYSREVGKDRRGDYEQT